VQLSLVPTIAVILINLCVVAYVLRQGDRTRSGFFLLINALSLIIWATGKTLYKLFGQESPWVLSLPYLAALIVPGNFLYYALTRPRPMGALWTRPISIFLIFLPALFITLFEQYDGTAALLFDYSYGADAISLESAARRAALLYAVMLLTASVAVLAVRYYTTTGPDQNISKHLIASIIGPLLFSGFFWISSQRSGPSLIPSPSMILVLTAQLSLIAVLRQEEIENPRLLSRIVLYAVLVLAAFLLINLLSEFYIFMQGGIVMDRTVGWMLIGAILVLFLVARLSWVERTFDRLMFTRAAEYRRLVEETRTELRDARERLRRSEKLSAIGELAARVAHEVKNPLGPIKGYTQMMREKLEADPDYRHRDAFLRHLGVIAEEVENIDRRLRQFLTASRQPILIMEQTNVNRLVDRCGRILNLEIAAAGELPPDQTPVSVKVQLDESVSEVMADGGKIEEAVFNLARNALDALTPGNGGYIRLRTNRNFHPDGEEGVLITVQDTGPGFDLDEAEKLFEPFYTNKEGGTGLGLAIVKSTVEAHSGTIELRNRPEGGGEVRLWIPCNPKENVGALLPKA
jgi:signal transduction histidine kinase